MAKLNLDGLRKLREQKKAEMGKRSAWSEIQIVIGMGTCGIAAGAKQTMDAFVAGLKENNLTETCRIKKTGCMGLCHSEPTVEIIIPGMSPVIYGMVDPEVSKKIIQNHIIGRELVDDHILERPAVDILAS
jgi:NADP-reducing hydrogenase subunit HndB